jgi:integrase
MKRFSGTIYKNGSRYWYKYKVAGESTFRQVPLKPAGMKYATKDLKTAELIAEQIWLRTIQQVPQCTQNSVAGIVQAYRQYAEKTYLPPSTETVRIKYATGPLIEFCGDIEADAFTPVHLKRYQDYLIDKYDLCRKTINDRVNVIKRVFKWAASELLVSPYVFTGLSTVENLHRGRSTAREGRKVLPVDEKHIKALVPFLSDTAADMMMVQYYTGMRSGEICQMTAAQIEMTKGVWLYRPARHKTDRLGHVKVVPLGPNVQQIIRPVMASRKPYEPLFQTMFGNGFDKDNYRKELIRAFKTAKEAGVHIPYFHPHQIRHTVGTKVRGQFGPEFARATLGQRTLSATEIYAELDLSKAEKVAKVIG